MTKFTIEVRRDISFFDTLDIQANNLKEAKQKAKDLMRAEEAIIDAIKVKNYCGIQIVANQIHNKELSNNFVANTLHL